VFEPAFIFAEVPATNSNNEKVIKPSDAVASHQGGSIHNPSELQDVGADDQLEYGEHDDSEENNYAVVEDEDGDRFLVFHPAEKRAPHSSFANMLRLDKKATYNPSFNSMLRLDKKEFNNHQNFANMLRLDKRSPFEDNLLRLDKKYANLLRLDKRGYKNYSPNFLRLDKKHNYQPSFNSMLRLDKKAPYKNQNFASMLRLDKKATNFRPSSFASNMLRLDKKSNYNPGFNSMLRLDKKFQNAFSNQLRLDKKSFKSSLRNFGLLRLDKR
jgi:hypothetical protein